MILLLIYNNNNFKRLALRAGCFPPFFCAPKRKRAGFTQPFFKAKENKRAGFTVMELIIVIIVVGLISVVAIPRAQDLAIGARVNSTAQELHELQRAIIGDADQGFRGYRHDMQALPAALTDLYTDPGTGFNVYNQIGWNGPYIDNRDTDGNGTADMIEDSWQNVYVYNAGAGTITSNGPDEAVGGGDDVTINLN